MGQGPRVRVAATGNDAELVRTLPITREPGAARRVALRLGQGGTGVRGVPDLRPGDLLRVMAEVEVTTDALRRLGSVGKPYDYAPIVGARLLLTDDREATEARDGHALRLGEPKRRRCTHRRHHRVLVFGGAGLHVPRQGLPWDGPSFVNLALGAHHPDAEADQVVLVGENEPDGTVRGDRGRISVVRIRPGSHRPPPPTAERAHRTRRIPVRKRERTVVFSLRLQDPEDGEQLVAKATMITSAAHLGYPARVSSRMFLADRPDQGEPGGRARDVAAFRGVITPFNGFNCLPERSPCTTRKVGIAYLRSAPRKDLYVNLVAVSADPFGGARRGDAVHLADGGFIEVVRYPPGLRG